MACVSTCLILSPRLTQVGLSSKKPLLIRLRSPVDRYSFPGISTERCLSTRRKLTRHGIAVVKAAGLDKVSGAIKPGGLVESDRLPTDVRKRAMQAVDECGRRVTVGDVASRTGLKVTEAQNALQAIAADTDGFLEVSDEGDVLYVFPKDYRTKLAAKSFRIQIEPFLEKAKGAIDYLARVSFGTALIASVVIVYTSIIVLLSSSKSEDDDDDNRQRRRGRGYDSGSNFYINSDPNYDNRRRAREDEEQGMNFIESVFSFVFGDGDPNQGIEEERWQMIGQYITSRGGVVAADELAPYLDVPSSKSATNDESYILPVLLRFDGQPELDEEGNILYRFPSLQRTASGSSRPKEDVGKWFDLVADMEKFFKEKKWQFSRTSTSKRAMVIGLGAVNLFGVIVLNALLMEMAVTPSGFLTFVKNIFPLLQIYAGSFFAIPLIRWFSIKRKNKQIENRNKARLQFAKALESPDIALRRKLLSARDMAQNTVIGKERIVYSTDRDMMEQNYETGTEDSKSWKNQIEMKSHLLPDAKLLSGRLYYLLPATTMIKKKVNKKVTFANPEVEDEERSLREDDATSESNNIDGDDNKNVSVVRMKIVVHKQELEKLHQGGSVHEMMYQTLEKQLLLTDDDDDDLECNRGWRPVLDSIPESESLI